VEIIRTCSVTAKSPTFAVAFAGHLLGSETDGIDAVNFPTGMMQARTVRVAKADDVVIAAVDAVKESDDVAAAVREAESQCGRIEIDRPPDVLREQDHVGETKRLHRTRGSQRYGARFGGGDGRSFGVGRDLAGRADLDLSSIVVEKPDGIA